MNATRERPTSATSWMVLLGVGAIGETACLVAAVVFGAAAYGEADGDERARLWTSAGGWLLGSLAFTAVSVWSLVRLLRLVARQAPGSASEETRP